MLSIKNLVKSYGNHKVLDNINLNIAKGQVVAIIGPSGSGKSTILRCVVGLEKYDQGEIDLATSFDYKVAMVFQNFNLFPNMTVMENLVYAPMKVMKFDRDKTESIAWEYLGKVGLKDFANKHPTSLSGGQKQRVAIARALCMQPEIVLFDEPTSALDPENVKEVLESIRQLAHTGITLIIVTHEMQFAREVADRVIFIDHGKIIEEGESKNLFDNPSSERLKNFLKSIL